MLGRFIMTLLTILGGGYILYYLNINIMAVFFASTAADTQTYLFFGILMLFLMGILSR